MKCTLTKSRKIFILLILAGLVVGIMYVVIDPYRIAADMAYRMSGSL